MLLFTKTKGHMSNVHYSGFPKHLQTKSSLHISVSQSKLKHKCLPLDTLYVATSLKKPRRSSIRQPSTKIQDMIVKYSHLPERIFQNLNNTSLFKCREVTRLWQVVIDGRNYTWLHIVNIPTILKKGNTYLHLAAETGQIQAFKQAFNQKDDRNIKNKFGETSLHHACKNGSVSIAQFLLKNTELENNVDAKDNLGINLNAKTKYGYTAFHWACSKGHSNVVKILMENAVALSIDLNTKDNTGMTGYHWACKKGHTNVAKVFMENAATLCISIKSPWILRRVSIWHVKEVIQMLSRLSWRMLSF